MHLPAGLLQTLLGCGLNIPLQQVLVAHGSHLVEKGDFMSLQQWNGLTLEPRPLNLTCMKALETFRFHLSSWEDRMNAANTLASVSVIPSLKLIAVSIIQHPSKYPQAAEKNKQLLAPPGWQRLLTELATNDGFIVEVPLGISYYIRAT